MGGLFEMLQRAVGVGDGEFDEIRELLSEDRIYRFVLMQVRTPPTKMGNYTFFTPPPQQRKSLTLYLHPPHHPPPKKSSLTLYLHSGELLSEDRIY